MFEVMTWNVENLFRPHTEGGPTSEAVYEAKLKGLAAMINAEEPDALSLQEVGSPAALADLVALLDGDWHRRVSQHPDHRGIRIAWLTPHDITHHEDILEFPDHLEAVQVDDDGTTLAEMGRGAIAITVTKAGKPIRLVTTHLKSKLLTFPGGHFQPKDEGQRARFGAYALFRRAAEAATLRVWATNALESGDPLVLTGDLNDTVQAATTQLLLGPPGSEIKTAGFEKSDHGDAQRLWNLAPVMPAGQDYSRINHGRKELIDHILVSLALVKPLDKVSAHAIMTNPCPPSPKTRTPEQTNPAPSTHPSSRPSPRSSVIRVADAGSNSRWPDRSPRDRRAAHDATRRAVAA